MDWIPQAATTLLKDLEAGREVNQARVVTAIKTCEELIASMTHRISELEARFNRVQADTEIMKNHEINVYLPRQGA